MRILALDTTTPTASAAVWNDGVMLGQYTIQTNTHSTTILPMIESLLANLGLTVPELDALAVSAGPGSFTGVRIGVSTIKGLAFSHQIPCIGVSSLEVLAWNLIGFQGILCPVINARRGHVYSAMFSSDGINPPVRLTDDDLVSVADLAAKLQNENKPVYAAGDGYAMLQNALAGGVLQNTPEFLRYPSGFSTACAAASVYSSNADASVFTEAALAPIYLRKSQAEREREERLAKEQADQKGE